MAGLCYEGVASRRTKPSSSGDLYGAIFFVEHTQFIHYDFSLLRRGTSMSHHDSLLTIESLDRRLLRIETIGQVARVLTVGGGITLGGIIVGTVFIVGKFFEMQQTISSLESKVLAATTNLQNLERESQQQAISIRDRANSAVAAAVSDSGGPLQTAMQPLRLAMQVVHVYRHQACPASGNWIRFDSFAPAEVPSWRGLPEAEHLMSRVQYQQFQSYQLNTPNVFVSAPNWQRFALAVCLRIGD
jgi:hypothetical protein